MALLSNVKLECKLKYIVLDGDHMITFPLGLIHK